MAYAYKVNRITMFGTSFEGAEEWSTGFYMGYEDQDADAPDLADLTTLATAWQTYFTTSSSKISGSWKTVGIKASHLNADGTTDLGATQIYTYGTPIQGGYNSGVNPPQVALVVTLKTAIARGLGANGRMFLPGISQGVQGNGKIIGAAQTEMADNLQDFFDAANTSWNTGTIINASKGRTISPTSPPINAEVTSIRLGDVYDTQRRRRNALVETYISRAIA